MPILQVNSSYSKANQLQTAPAITRYVPSFKAEEDKLEKSSETKDEANTEVKDESETETDSETKSEKDKKDSSSNIKLYVALGVVAVAAGLAIAFKKPLGEWLAKLRKKSEGVPGEAGAEVHTSREQVIATPPRSSITDKDILEPRPFAPVIDAGMYQQEYRDALKLTPESPKSWLTKNKDTQNADSPLVKEIEGAKNRGENIHLGKDDKGNTVLTTFKGSGRNKQVASITKFDGEGKFIDRHSFYPNGQIRTLEEKVDGTRINITSFDQDRNVILLGQTVNGKVENIVLYDHQGKILFTDNNDFRIFYHSNGKKAIEIDKKNDLTTVYREDGSKILKKKGKDKNQYFSPDGSDSSRIRRKAVAGSIVRSRIDSCHNMYNSIKDKNLIEALKALKDELKHDSLFNRLFGPLGIF